MPVRSHKLDETNKYNLNWVYLYHLALETGYFVGTLQEWLDSLNKGSVGKSAYELSGYSGTQEEWIAMIERRSVFRRTAQEWSDLNPVLGEDMLGFVTGDRVALKIGDGIHDWNSLPYVFGNATTSQTGFMTQEQAQLLNNMVSEIDVGDLVALFENRLL